MQVYVAHSMSLVVSTLTTCLQAEGTPGKSSTVPVTSGGRRGPGSGYSHVPTPLAALAALGSSTSDCSHPWALHASGLV